MVLAVVSTYGMIILGVVVLLLFGHRLPETMRSLGKGMTEFKKGMREGEKDEDEPPRVGES
jgi:sec-independent protein translocase protein TatA